MGHGHRAGSARRSDCRFARVAGRRRARHLVPFRVRGARRRPRARGPGTCSASRSSPPRRLSCSGRDGRPSKPVFIASMRRARSDRSRRSTSTWPSPGSRRCCSASPADLAAACGRRRRERWQCGPPTRERPGSSGSALRQSTCRPGPTAETAPWKAARPSCSCSCGTASREQRRGDRGQLGPRPLAGEDADLLDLRPVGVRPSRTMYAR